MKHMAAALLAAALTLCSPALAAESSPAFFDVEAGSWYEQGVTTCVQAGLMQGTGDRKFSPKQRLSQPECLTLALRLYDLCHGGGGVLPPAPEDWDLGEFTLTLADGTELTAPVSDPEAVNFQPTGLLFYLEHDRRDWAKQQDGAAATLRYQGDSYFSVLQFWDADGGEAPALIFPVTYGMPFYEVYEQLSQRSSAVPSRSAWYRDAWYYLEEHKLADQLYFSFETDTVASREQLAIALALSGAELAPLNQIQSLPDSRSKEVLDLYNAGVLTGVDAYGRFSGEGGLTRAEAAVLCARLLDPAQRKAFTPLQPTGTQPYTLTYLLDGTPDGGVTYPLCVLGGSDGGASGVLTLDGRLLPWPGVTPSFGLYQDGEYCYFSVWDEVDGEVLYNTAKMKTGLMDREGTFPVPMGAYDNLHSTGDGHLLGLKIERPPDAPLPRMQWFLLSADGTAEAQLLGTDETPDNNWWGFNLGVCPWEDGETGLWGYVDAAGNWVASPVWESASGFKDGYATVRSQGKDGVIDLSGTLVIPYGGAQLANMGQGLFFGYDWTQRADTWVRPGAEPREVPYGLSSYRSVQNGYLVSEWGLSDSDEQVYCYLDENLAPVTPAEFDWAGAIGPDGKGFVGKDGKIYRIEFN